MHFDHIIISGEAGSGKDCVGSYLVSEYGYVRVAYGDEIKLEVLNAYERASPSLDLVYMNKRSTKETPDNRLALMYCEDSEFTKIAMEMYREEDQLLFDVLRCASNHKLNLSVSEDIDIIQNAIKAYKEDEILFKAFCASQTTSESKKFTETSFTSITSSEQDSFTEAQRMKLPRSPRRITQIWGTEYRREQDPNYWLNKIQDFIESSKSPVVITDGRTKLELDNAAKNNIHRIHVENPFLERKVAAHSSEQIPPPDSSTFLIINDKFDDNFKSLYEKAEKALQQFGIEKFVSPKSKSLVI